MIGDKNQSQFRSPDPMTPAGQAPGASGARVHDDNRTVTKKELVSRIADRTGQTKVITKDIIQMFLDEIITGSHPMNVRGLHGELNAPQKARTQLYTANLPPVGQSLIEGQLAWFDGTMYAYIPGTPGSWEPVGGQTGNMFLYGPYAGRPATALDGTIYFATDRQVA